MKILAFNGSPKKKSDTMHITRAFLEGMQKAGPQEIRTIDQIEFCWGCFACKYNGGQCSIDDDMRALLEQMLSGDVLLFSFPLYCYGCPPR